MSVALRVLDLEAPFFVSMYITHSLVSKSTPLAVTGPHGLLASILICMLTVYLVANILCRIFVSVYIQVPIYASTSSMFVIYILVLLIDIENIESIKIISIEI